MTDNIIGIDGHFYSTRDISSNNNFLINNVMVMNNTSLGNNVINSNLQSLGTLLQLNVSGSSTMSNLTTQTLVSKALNIDSGTIASLYTTNGNISSLTSANINTNNMTVSNLQSSLINSNITNVNTLNAGQMNLTNGNAMSFNIDNLVAGNTSIGNIKTTSLIVNNSVSNSQSYPPIFPQTSVSGETSNTSYQFSVSSAQYGNGTYIYSSYSGGVLNASKLSNLVSGNITNSYGTIWQPNSTTNLQNDYNNSFPYQYNNTTVATTDINNNTYYGLYLQIQLPTAIYLTGVAISANTTSAPASMYVLASNDSVNWTCIDITGRVTTGWNATQTQIIPIYPSINTNFSYYRFIFFELAGAFEEPIIGQFYLMGGIPTAAVMGIGNINPQYPLDVNGNINASGYLVNNNTVLSSTTLGSNIVNSSLQTVGTLTNLAVSGNIYVASTGTISALYTNTANIPVLNATNSFITSASISSLSSNTANIANINATNLNTSSGSVAALYTNFANIPVLNATNSFITSASISSLSSNTANIANINATNLNISSGSVAALYTNFANISTLNATNANITSGTIGTLFTTNMNISSLTSSNLITTSIAGIKFNNNSNFGTTIQASTSTASNFTLTLPINTGTSGFVLSTGGTNGQLSWISAASGNVSSNSTNPMTTGALTCNLIQSTQSNIVGYNTTSGLLTYQPASTGGGSNVYTNSLIIPTYYTIPAPSTQQTTSGVITAWSYTYAQQTTGQYMDIYITGQIYAYINGTLNGNAIPLQLQYNVNGGSWSNLAISTISTSNNTTHISFPFLMATLPSLTIAGGQIGLQLLNPTGSNLLINGQNLITYKIAEYINNIQPTYITKTPSSLQNNTIITAWSHTYTQQTTNNYMDIYINGTINLLNTGTLAGANIPLQVQYNVNSGSWINLCSITITYNSFNNTITFPMIMGTIPVTTTIGNIIGLQIVNPIGSNATINIQNIITYKIVEYTNQLATSGFTNPTYITKIPTISQTTAGALTQWSTSYTAQSSGNYMDIYIVGQVNIQVGGNNKLLQLQYNINGGTWINLQLCTISSTFNNSIMTIPTIIVTLPFITSVGQIIGFQLINPSDASFSITTATCITYKIYEYSASMNPWLGNGNKISYIAGNVGVGITNPSVAMDVSGSVRANDMIINNPVYLRYNNAQTCNAYIFSNLASSASSTANTNTFTPYMTYLLNFGTTAQENYNWNTPVWGSNVNLQVPYSGLYNISITFGFTNPNATFALDCFISKNATINNNINTSTATLAFSSCTSSTITLSTNTYLTGVTDTLNFGFISYITGTYLSNKTTLTITQVQKTVSLTTNPPVQNITVLSGSVGIGTTNPSNMLNVFSTNTASTLISGFYQPNLVNSSETYIQLGRSNTTYNGGEIGFNLVGNGSTSNWLSLDIIGRNNTLCVNGVGNVGIGISNPLCPLQVTGKVRIGSANSSNVTDPLVLCLNTDNAVLGNNSNLANLRFRCTGTDNYAEILSNDLGLRGGINQPLRIVGSPIEFNTYSGGGVTPMMTLTNSNDYGLGYVGIGTTNPSVPLHVYSSATYSIGGNTGKLYSSTTIDSIGNNYFNLVSIVCSKFISSWGVIASSDRRIKTNIIQADTSIALSKILELPLMKYDYIDKIEYGDDNVYGLIAQHVKEILPECVTIITKLIPSIYKLATNINLSDDEENVIISVDIPETSEIKVDGIVELIIEGKENKYQTKVISFTSSQLVVKKWDNFDETKMVFVYGVEINDFHSIDKAYISLLCMGGIQELSKRNDVQNTTITTQQTTIDTLNTRVSSLEQTILTMQSQINSLLNK